MMHAQEALDKGFVIDYTAAGRPVAFKGERFRPDAIEYIHTGLETRRIKENRRMKNLILATLIVIIIVVGAFGIACLFAVYPTVGLIAFLGFLLGIMVLGIKTLLDDQT